MPRIRCNYEGCIHLEGNLCTAGEIELDQELGCLTFSQVDEEEIGVAVEEGLVDEEWEDVLDEEEEDEDEDWEDLDDEDEDEDEDDEW
jgi:hypothetical protein